MPINFNLSPYYDDFDESKGFHRILFKPGFAVQARELTQIQTQLQNQITKFGNHIFKEGSVVLGGNFTRTPVDYITISRNYNINLLLNQDITGATSGAVARVLKVVSISDDVAKLYIQYNSGTKFVKDENVIGTDVTSIEKTVNSSTFSGTADMFSIEAGVFYTYGNFVYCNEQSIIISEDALTSCRVGLFVSEEIVESTQDTSLLDPALGSYNYSAPGADRYGISLDLVYYPYDGENSSDPDENSSQDFIELVRILNGALVNENKIPIYSEIEKTLARRTYDESGDYTVRSFGVKVNDHIGANDSLLSLQVEPGKAYVKGYEYETIASTYLDLEKSREKSSENEFPIYINYGKFFYIKGMSKGAIDFTDNIKLDLRDNVRLTSGNTLGNCITKYIEYDSLDGSTPVYKLYVDQLQLKSGVSVANVISLNTTTFQANISSNSYSTGVRLEGNDNPTYIIRIPKNYVATVNSAETSYQTTKRITSGFTVTGAYANSTVVNSGTTNQVFLGSGTLSQADTQSLYLFTVSITSNAGLLPVGTVLDYTTHNLRVTIVNETTMTVTTNIGFTFTALVFAKVSVVEAERKTKNVTDGSIVLTGGSLTRANLIGKISLGKADCISLDSVIVTDNASATFDYTSKYSFSTGQTNVLYDHGYITLKPGYADPISDGVANISSVTISFKYNNHIGDKSGFFDVQSYSEYSSIPSYTSTTGEVYDLHDCFDFRARRVDDSTAITGSLLGEPSTLIVTDFEYYLGRIDKLILTKDRKLTLIQGVSAVSPTTPVDMPDAMGLYIINIPPYTKSKDEVSITYIENKRYTMRDIGKIEKRVEKLEYYTSLSLLEKQASDESIPSDVPTIDRFKNGILVDSFAGHSVGDVRHPAYRCAVDYQSRILRPSFATNSVEFNYHYGTNVIQNGDIITLDYNLELLTQQPLSSTWVNVNPYSVFLWDGVVKLNPATDTWTDTTTKPDVTVNLNGENDVFTTFVDNVENPASVGTKWSDWSVVGKGVPQVTGVSTSSSVVTATSTAVTTSTTTVTAQTTTIKDTLAKVGLEISTGEVQTITKDLGTKVVDVSLVPYIRSRIIKFHAHSMKPLTNVFAIFDEVNVTPYCFPATEILINPNTYSSNATSIALTSNTAITADIIFRRMDRIYVAEKNGVFNANSTFNWVLNANTVGNSVALSVIRKSSLTTNEKGDICGLFSIPNNDKIRFRVGEKEFKLSDSVGQGATTVASSKYVAQGLSKTQQDTIISTRVSTVSVKPVLQTLDSTRVSYDTIVTKSVDVVPIVPCNHVQGGGAVGKHEFKIDFGGSTGMCGITFDSSAYIPDRYTIIWDGQEFSSGFVGSSDFNQGLWSRGYPGVSSTAAIGRLAFNKTKNIPSTAILRVEAPFQGTTWNYRVICPGEAFIAPTRTSSVSIGMSIGTPGSIGFTFAHAPQTTWVTTGLFLTRWSTVTNNGIPTQTAQVQYYLETAGTSSPHVRISSMSATSGGTLSHSAWDLDTAPHPSIPGQRFGSAWPTLTVDRPGDGVGYGVSFTGVARVYQDAARTILLDALPFQAWNSAYVWRNDAVGRPQPPADPVAQTFFVNEGQYPEGIFLESLNLFFRSKSTSLPVLVEIRPVVNGYPSSTEIVPFSIVSLEGDQVSVSANASIPTNFQFDAPIYLPPGEHAFVVRSASTDYEIYSAVLGEKTIHNPNVRITEQPALGSMFKSQNSSTWTAVQEEDLMFNLYKCAFKTGTANTGYAILHSSYETAGSLPYDVLFADGENLDFASTDIKYFRKTTSIGGVDDSSWTRYQLGHNESMVSRRTLRPNIGTDLRFLLALTTTSKDVSPVIDLSRFTSVIIRNNINNGSLQRSDFTITDYGIGYTQNANVAITATHGTGATAYAKYNANTSKLEVIVTNGGSGYIGDVTAVIDRSSGATANANVTVRNEISSSIGNSYSRYITRKVTLATGFESTDLKSYILANVPTGTTIYMYYKVAPESVDDFDSQPWRLMELESSGAPSEIGFIEFKYKTPGETALPSGERFKTFTVKITMLSDNTVRVPQIKDLRVIAIDE